MSEVAHVEDAKVAQAPRASHRQASASARLQGQATAQEDRRSLRQNHVVQTAQSSGTIVGVKR